MQSYLPTPKTICQTPESVKYGRYTNFIAYKLAEELLKLVHKCLPIKQVPVHSNIFMEMKRLIQQQNWILELLIDEGVKYSKTLAVIEWLALCEVHKRAYYFCSKREIAFMPLFRRNKFNRGQYKGHSKMKQTLTAVLLKWSVLNQVPQVIPTNFSALVPSSYESFYPISEEFFILISMLGLYFFLYHLRCQGKLLSSGQADQKIRRDKVRAVRRISQELSNPFCEQLTASVVCRMRSSVLLKKHAFILPCGYFLISASLTWFFLSEQ